MYEQKYMRPEQMFNSVQVLWGLIAVNVLFYILVPVSGRWFQELVLWSVPERFRIYQLLTSGVLHGSFGHLLFNMWGLYLFGKFLVPYLKPYQLLVLYAAGVLSGNLLYLAVNWGVPSMVLGASGAVCAIMMAAAMLEPERRIVLLIMPFNPLKMSTMIICYTLLEFLLGFGAANSGIAHLAHLGGFAGGYLVLKLMRRPLAWDPWRMLSSRLSGTSGAAKKTPPPKARTENVKTSGGRVTAAELDALLDKLSRTGVNSLSDAELARLRQAREEMRNRKSAQ